MPHSTAPQIRLDFPFTINNTARSSIIRTTIERKENLVSFSLPFDLQLKNENLGFISKKEVNGQFIYVYEIDPIYVGNEYAFEVEQASRSEEVNELQRKMDEFMEEYEKKEKRNKKR